MLQRYNYRKLLDLYLDSCLNSFNPKDKQIIIIEKGLI